MKEFAQLRWGRRDKGRKGGWKCLNSSRLSDRQLDVRPRKGMRWWLDRVKDDVIEVELHVGKGRKEEMMKSREEEEERQCQCL
jgi:hypothetical protein